MADPGEFNQLDMWFFIFSIEIFKIRQGLSNMSPAWNHFVS